MLYFEISPSTTIADHRESPVKSPIKSPFQNEQATPYYCQSNFLEQRALHAYRHCRAFHSGGKIQSSYFSRQKSANNQAKKILIHLREIQSFPVSLNTEYSKAEPSRCDLICEIWGRLLYIRLNVSGSLFSMVMVFVKKIFRFSVFVNSMLRLFKRIKYLV